MAPVVRPALAAAVTAVVLASACGSGAAPAAAPAPSSEAAAAASREAPPEAPGQAPPEASEDVADEPAAEGEPGDGDDAVPSPDASTSAQDALAGVLARNVPAYGSGRTEVVPGAESAPGGGRLQRVRVEVEGGIPVDGAAFATMVMTTLNDPRSWGGQGWSFARTDGGDADLVVRLASPRLSERLCRPLRTRGTLSCRSGEGVILTHHRWVKGQEDYGDDLTGYRQYVVNHEVGHALGRGHTGCPAPGAPAPVMQQQTIEVDPCVPNPWVEP